MSETTYDLKMDQIEKRVQEAVEKSGQKKCRVQYSAYESDDNGDPIDNLDQIAATGKVVLVREANDFFGGEDSEDYKSEVLENPTWLQVCVRANKMMKVVRDRHHVYLEGLTKEKEEDGVLIYRFIMGS